MSVGSIHTFSVILFWLVFNTSLSADVHGIRGSNYIEDAQQNDTYRFNLTNDDNEGPFSSKKSHSSLLKTKFCSLDKTDSQNRSTSEIDILSHSHELVIIDKSVSYYEQLLSSFQVDSPNRHFVFALVDSGNDGIDQVSSILKKYKNLDAVHLISHGLNGTINLGNTHLSLNNFHLYSDHIESWRASLSEDADLLLYACDLASNENGMALARKIQSLTEADVAASTDNTGHYQFNGDWDLELNLGDIKAKLPFDESLQYSWKGVLNTFIVTNTKNGGGGSLRRAINDANSMGGADDIHFNIPLDDPNHLYYKDDGIPGSLSIIATTTLADAAITDFDPDYPGTPFSWYSIQLTSVLPIILTRVVLDGTSQLTFDGRTGLEYPVIEIDGTSIVALDPNGLTIESTGSEIRGLAINRCDDDGIEIEFGDNNIIVGNHIGTDVTGTIAYGNEWGINVKSEGNLIGGTTTADRNVISGNNSDGIYIFGEDAQDNTIIGNYIGTDVTGTNPLGNGFDGIYFAEFLNQSPDDHTIGGVNPGEGNVIAFNDGCGIAMFRKTGSGHAILGNSIHSNQIIGIDFDYDGVTHNDDLDSDSGPNDQLNYPVLINVEQNGPDVDVALFVDLPAGNYRIELFENPGGVNSTGFGEGEVFLGALSVTSLGTGAERFALTMNSVTVTDPLTVTSTATEDLGAGDYGSTSEFGPAFSGAGVLVVDTDTDVNDGDTQSVPHLISNRGADGLISLREAMTAANNSPNFFATDEIQFNIGTGGVQTIQPTGPLPWPTEAVIIDGTTQPGHSGTPLIELDGQLAGASVAGIGLNTGSDGSEVRGLAIFQFSTNGILVLTDGNTIAGNYFGLDASGTNAPGNANRGIYVSGSNNIIGGTDPTDRNVISGNGDNGLDIIGNNNLVQGNYIGTDALGAADLGNAARGIYLYNLAADNTIGGIASDEGNLIAYNGSQGISLHNTANSGNSILGNQIHSNDGIGIDLGENGVTYNDNNDTDGGPNSLLNFPVITNIEQNGPNLDLTYVLELPSGDYRIEFFENPTGVDATGFGEAESMIGTVSVTSSGTGPESFSSTLSSVTVADSTTVTAVATEDLGAGDFGNSSEIGPAFIGAGVLIVDTDSDVDDGDTNSIAELLGNRGADSLVSLREAVIALNNTGNIDGPDKIYFNIDGGGAQTIQPTSLLPDISDDLIIDGSTQPGYVNSPIIEVDGSSAGNGNGLTLVAGSDGSTIRGMVINQFDKNGILIMTNDNTIEANYIGTNIDGDAVEGNAWSGIRIEGGASNNVIGGSTTAVRNIISGNEDGISIAEAGTSGNAIKGNYIGTDESGFVDLGNLENGIIIYDDASNTTVGGSIPGEGNLISGNESNGIGIGTSSTTAYDITIQGNLIGSDISGSSAIPNDLSGIDIDDGQDIVIGGTVADASNIIAFNGEVGIEVDDAATNTTFLGNAIFENVSLGIDWNDDGVTPNDAGDANSVQNFPILTTATVDGLDISIDGTLNSKASTSFRIEFFASSMQDPSNHGEGASYLGFVTTTTNASGNASFSTTITTASPVDEYISATATDLAAKTSEFSLSITANDVPTLTSFADAVETTDEDTEVEISFGDLELEGDENDVDGTVDAFIVKAVSSGSLKIGADAGSATAWATSTNETIDASNNAYWTPANDANGTLNVMEVVAKDDDGAESVTAGVIAQVTVNDINDLPTLTSFATVAETTDEDTEIEITFAELQSQGNEADLDGTVNAFIVKAVSSGSLKIGADAGSATVWAASTNETIDASNNAYWTPANDANGTLNAMEVVAKDDDGDESVTVGVIAQVTVNDINDIPTLSSFAGVVETTNEDTEVEITFVELTGQGNEADIDGTVDAFIVKAISTGTLKIGATAGSATAWAASTNETIDATNNAYWTPANNANGTLNAMEVVAKDDDGDESVTAGVIAQVTVNEINDIPTLSTFAGVVETTNEDTEVEITFAELSAQGNEADIDGTVDAFIVKAVSTGTLKIGATALSATAWAASTNETIDVTNNAYWTSANNANGTLDAMEVVAKDDDGAESVTAGVIAQVTVNDINDIPTLSTFAGVVETTDEDTEVEITFAELTTQGNEADIDGTVDAFIVKAVSSGSLKIGATAGTAAAWAASTNETIDATNNAYWTPANNANGTLNAMEVVAKDNDGDESVTAGVIAQVTVNDINDIPTLSSFAGVVETTNEDTEIEITFAELQSQGNEADVDGTVDAFIVKAVSSGTLKIGTDAGSATAWAASTNETIDASNNAYWTPSADANGTLNAMEVVANDDDGAESVTAGIIAQVTVNDINDLPTLTSFAAVVETTDEDTEVEITFADLQSQGNEADVDGTVDAFIVKGVSSGTLKIGTDAGSATTWAASTNETIDASNNAYWTPTTDANGTLNAMEVVAKDDDDAESVTAGVIAQVTVNDINDLPTLTSFAAVVETTNEDTEVEIIFAELQSQGNEADVDGTVDAFIVNGVSSGTLKIGADAGSATAWAASANETIDASNNAYWTPATDAIGTLNAMEVVAKDDDDAESITAGVIAQVTVNDINDIPTLTSFAAVVETTDEDTEVEVTFAELQSQGNEADVDGTVDAFIVKAVSGGSLKIGADAGSATAWVASTNETIDASNKAYWTPATDANGTLNVMEVVAKDDDDAESVTAGVIAQVTVNDINDLPTLTSFATVAEITDEDTEVEITFAELQSQGNEADVDGTVDAFIVKGVSSGSLKIGADAGSATAWAASTNETIDASNNAYWTPATDANGTLNAIEVVARDDDGAESVTAGVIAQVTVNDINDSPVADDDAAIVNEGAGVTINIVDGDSDVDGTLDYASISISNQTNGSVTDNGDGTVNFVHDDSETLTASFNYTINDNNGALSNIALVSITVNPVNDPPVADDDVGAVLEGVTVTIDIADGDFDSDGSLNLGSISISNEINGSVTDNGDGTVNFTHDGSETLTGSFTYTINDNSGASSNEANVTITVTPQNDVPVADDDIATVNEGAAVTINIANGDGDVDGSLDLSSIVISNQTNGSVVDNGDGTVDFTHDDSETLVASFTYTINDNDGGTSNLASVNITVNPQNDAPTLTNFDCSVESTLIDTEVEITLAQLLAQGDENDDGGVIAFKVKSVSSGSLLIGASKASANPFVAGSNETIDISNNAYWTPDTDQEGTLDALELVAVDGSDFESTTTGVIAKVDVIFAGIDQTLCATSTTLEGTNPTAGSGNWSIISGVGGTFVNLNDPATSFNGAAGESYLLRWEITNGSCESSSDTVNITFDENPTLANAGNDSTLCANTITLAANTPTIGNGEWSISSGTGGSFNDINDPATTFDGISGETYMLAWTIRNGSCSQSTDDLTITFDKQPTIAVAGSNETECVNSVMLNANIPAIGTGQWSITSGVGGNLMDEADPTTTFTGLEGESYVLTWTIRNGSCTPSYDTMSISDEVDPIFDICPTSFQVVSMDTMNGKSIITWLPPKALDNCSTVDLFSEFSPNQEFDFGSHLIEYTATDKSGNDATCTFTISSGFNRFPIADNISENTLQGQPIDIALAAFDPDGDDVSIVDIRYDTANAIISNINPDNLSFTYTALEHFYGFDTLIVSISDNAIPFNITFAQVIVEVERVSVLKISSAMTINGDGVNDHWHLENIDLFPNNTIHIYDRWGGLIYQSSGYDNISTVWKGYKNGDRASGSRLVPVGTYFYVIDLGNGSKKLLGPVEVIR